MLFIILIQCVFPHFALSYSDKPILIIVSYDGFRHDYLSKALTPAMMKLRREGTYADFLYNVFPTKTFTNHFSIATGMYAEEHGVVGNSFYDPALKLKVELGRNMFDQNPAVIPIWTLNELADSSRYSGCMMWPGCKYPYQNVTTTYFENWNHKYDMYKRIDTAISWITDRQYPANLVMIYIEEPDFQSHIYSPDSTNVKHMINTMDNITFYLYDQLKKKHLSHLVNVVHVGDHGMISIKYKNIINVTNYLEPDTYRFEDSSPTLHVHPKEGYENDVYTRLKRASIELGNFNVYRKNEMPNRWHYKYNVRTPPILLVAEKGYAFQDFERLVKNYEKQYDIKVTPNTLFGMHGYDLNVREMYSIFMARGPKIKKNTIVDPFKTVDLYSLFADILGLPSNRPKNSKVIRDVIDKKEKTHIFSIVIITVGGTILSLLLVGCAAVVTIILIKRQQNMTTKAALNKRFPQSFQQTTEAQHLLDAEEA